MKCKCGNDQFFTRYKEGKPYAFVCSTCREEKTLFNKKSKYFDNEKSTDEDKGE